MEMNAAWPDVFNKIYTLIPIWNFSENLEAAPEFSKSIAGV